MDKEKRHKRQRFKLVHPMTAAQNAVRAYHDETEKTPADPAGGYTGAPRYGGTPEQDADDL